MVSWTRLKRERCSRVFWRDLGWFQMLVGVSWDWDWDCWGHLGKSIQAIVDIQQPQMKLELHGWHVSDMWPLLTSCISPTFRKLISQVCTFCLVSVWLDCWLFLIVATIVVTIRFTAEWIIFLLHLQLAVGMDISFHLGKTDTSLGREAVAQIPELTAHSTKVELRRSPVTSYDFLLMIRDHHYSKDVSLFPIDFNWYCQSCWTTGETWVAAPLVLYVYLALMHLKV